MRGARFVKLSWLAAGMTLAVGCASQGGDAGTQAALNAADGAASRVVTAGQAAGAAVQAGRAATQATTAEGALTANPLVQRLVRQLGVAPEQAAGGAGLLFQSARQRMAPAQFQTLERSVPEVDRLMAAAPRTGQTATGLSSLLGGAGDTVGQAAGLIQGFRQLNLSPDMVNQFIPIVVDYVKETGGNALASALQAALVGG